MRGEAWLASTVDWTAGQEQEAGLVVTAQCSSQRGGLGRDGDLRTALRADATGLSSCAFVSDLRRVVHGGFINKILLYDLAFVSPLVVSSMEKFFYVTFVVSSMEKSYIVYYPKKKGHDIWFNG